jgi:serine/threonine protein kinase
MASRYKLLEELGKGGAGAVFKAYDTQLDRYVAIKRLMTREEAEKQDEKAGMLKKEAASLATLQHPNIIAVYDLGSDEEGFFMVMELVEGEMLSDWVRTTPMNLTDFQELAGQTLEALLTAHGQSILHRDLKPENIKIKRLPGGRIQVKVLDFGLARMSYGAKKMTEDQSGNVIGSIYYMAPEQFMRKPVDVRTDLYSLGCVFYQALSCRRPYTDDTVQGVMNAHLKHMVHPLKSVAPEVPEPICDWVMWLINAEPGHRPPNVEAALASLREIINAGWFNPSITAAIPVAIPEVSSEGWPATSSVPRAPTSAHVRTVSGSVSQRISSTQSSRPTGAIPPRPGGPAMPMPARPVRRAAPAEEEKSKLPFWIWPTLVAAVALVAAWYFWHSKTAGASKSGTASTTRATAREANFLQRGVLIHYVAGEQMIAWSEPGKPVAVAKPNDAIMAWHDSAPIGDDGMLVAWDKNKKTCPSYTVENAAGLKFGVGLAHFVPGQALMHRMEKSDPRCSQYPFGDLAKSRGMTAMMLVRPQLRNSDVRCLRLRNQDGTAWIDVRAYPNNDWKLMVKTGAVTKEAKLSGRSVSQFSLVGITWNINTGKAVLSVRGEDGGKARAETVVPNEIGGVLNEIRLSDYSKDPAKPVAPADQFAGDIAEIVVWPYAMEWEQRSAQEWKFMEFYFKVPGNQY